MGRFVRIAQNVRTGEYVEKAGYKADYEPMDLVCDVETKVVFYKLTERVYMDDDVVQKVGYMSPYISENGKMCRLQDGQLKEIV